MTSSKSPPSRKPAPLPTTQELLDFINAAPEPVGKREIARAFGLRGADNKLALKQLLRQVQDQAGLHRSKRRLAPPGHAAHAGHTHAAVPDVLVVVVSGTDSDGELLARPVEWSGSGIPPRITLTPWRKGQDALGMGDKVLVRLRRAGRHAYDGEPIKVLEATQSRVLGLFEAMADGSGRIHPTSRKERADYLVPRGESGGAASGDLVIASPMPGRVYGLRPAKIDEVLGSIHAPRSASAIALYGNDIPDVFPAEAVAQAEAATAVPLGDRTDLRRIPLVTIDGEDARDFDDAVWATADDDPGNSGGWRCMVAIADVAWYVRPQDALDREAYRRGNSTYFPDRVVPMLPEALSNGWCSLVPHEDRGCMAVEFVIDRHGNKRSHRFCRGLMRSAARLTYDQVQRARDGQPVHGGNQHHQKDRADGKAAGDRAEPDMEHAVKVIGQAAFRHDVAHEDEHRQRQQRIPFHQLHRGREAHVVPPRAPERERRQHGDEADDPEDALPRHHHQQHGREHQGGDHLVGHQMVSPRMVAMSLASDESACSSIRMKPVSITSLMGQR